MPLSVVVRSNRFVVVGAAAIITAAAVVFGLDAPFAITHDV